MRQKLKKSVATSGLFGGYADFRYGRANGSAKNRRPIFTGARRELAVQSVLTRLRNWHLSHFEREGETRAGVRMALCLEGHPWEAADAEAKALVSEGLRRMGAVLPSWEEGQWHYAVPQENCARCGCEIDEEDRAKGFRYCSPLCAKSYRQHLADQVPSNHVLRWQGYWQIVVSTAPVITCKHCATKFKDKRGRANAVYCSTACESAAKRYLEDRACEWCDNTFHPRVSKTRFCSTDCRDAHIAHEWQMRAPAIACAQCSTVFRPGSHINPDTKFCSPRCRMDAKNATRRVETRTVAACCEGCGANFEHDGTRSRRYCSNICASITGYFRQGRPPRVLSSPVFDYLLRCEGVRITDSPRVTDRLFEAA